MSSKINVLEIIKGHADTLRGANGKILISDIATFYGVPIILAAIAVTVRVNLTDGVISMLVNFGAIFTALLLSVLVLVYDQETKLDSGPDSPLKPLKKSLLRSLYYNISYSIVCSVVLIFVCFVHAAIHLRIVDVGVAIENIPATYGWIVTSPLAVFLTTNMFLTIIMIVKRMHTLLTTG